MFGKGKKKKAEFKSTEPTEEMIKGAEEPTEEVIEEETPEAEQVEEEAEEEEEVEEDEDETDEEKELKKKLDELKKKKQEKKAQEPKVLIRERAVPVESMFNNLSDRIEGIELYIAQLDSFLRNKLKVGK